MATELPVRYDLGLILGNLLYLTQVGDSGVCLILPKGEVTFQAKPSYIRLVSGNVDIKLTANTLVDGDAAPNLDELMYNLWSLLS